jgi:hypothetical protein
MSIRYSRRNALKVFGIGMAGPTAGNGRLQ